MFLTKFRKPVDTFAPSVGQMYRTVRDFCVSRKARETKYGFTLAGSTIMSSDDFEAEEVRTFLEFLDGHDAVLDIGANVGFYSCLAASRGKQVVSFEPSARNLKFLYKNLWDNGLPKVEVFPVGLAKEKGLSMMFGFGGISSFVPGWGQAQTSKGYLVPVTTLDTVAAGRFEGKKLLIKMDVEGFELDVLAGATKTLDLNPKPTWLMEILLQDGVIPGGMNRRFNETFEIFWAHGYQCRKLDESRAIVQQSDLANWINRGTADCTDFLFSER